MIDKDDLKLLGSYIAGELIKEGLKRSGEDWIEEDSEDHLLGELARCMTLQNIYLDREEYEKCAVMKVKIKILTDKLSIEDEINPGDIEDGDEIK